MSRLKKISEDHVDTDSLLNVLLLSLPGKPTFLSPGFVRHSEGVN